MRFTDSRLTKMGYSNVLVNTIYLDRTRLLNADNKKNGKSSAITIKTQYFAPKRSITQAYHQNISTPIKLSLTFYKTTLSNQYREEKCERIETTIFYLLHVLVSDMFLEYH